jgi:ATP-dependent Clp protease ATP-binding subunit ClpA
LSDAVAAAILAAMFMQFSPNARQVVVHAQEEARELCHVHVGTEHLLLGLMYPAGCHADFALTRVGLNRTAVRARVRHHDPGGLEPTDDSMPFTERASSTLELALREMRRLGQKLGTPEHMLLGLLMLEDSVAVQIIRDSGVDIDILRGAVLEDRSLWDQELSALGPADAEAVVMSTEIRPAADVQDLLMVATARAEDEGRSEFTVRDLLMAIRHDRSAAVTLAELGTDDDPVPG